MIAQTLFDLQTCMSSSSWPPTLKGFPPGLGVSEKDDGWHAVQGPYYLALFCFGNQAREGCCFRD